MRSSPPSTAPSRSIFSLGTPERGAMVMERRNSSTPSRSSSTPRARLPPRSPLNVDEEYDSAFKSKSFLDLWSNAHHHLRHTFSSSFKRSKSSRSFKAGGGSSSSSSSSSSCHRDDEETAVLEEQSCSYTVLDDFVLEPSPEVLSTRRRRRRRRRVDSVLMEYFEVTQEACSACSSLLAAIGAARRHHLTLRRLLFRMDKENGNGSSAATAALEAHVRLDNPLGPGCLSAFHDAHARCGPLATRLAAARRRLRRLARAARVARGAAAAALVTATAAAIVAAVVFAAHAVVGVGAAAAAAAVGNHPVRRAAENRYGAAVDAAARGAYIVGRDLDTVSRMVRRAHDELEHGRHVARIAVVRGNGERPLLQEVAREEAECEADLRAQLEELEEHVCLCLITINRTRRMVAHHITQHPPPPPPAAAALNNTPPPPSSSSQN